ncbi:GNAT family N-acetyltransferase [Bacillus mangrovi]|uniref:GNAT family N-acetyltransferase n=1 Tax=Metabacillus mangrovi TaxID=1491830 RepID=A0A7X2V3K9_9BACI|nr:GNAT family N-acetyltransferase [Metabacillus mangrovi]MTH52108.1 GNAT family N-acetyltransferase [Metabacillus mangrovi]
MEQQFKTKDGRTAVIRPVKMEDAEGIIRAAASIVKSGIYIQKEKVRTIQEEQDLIKELQAKGHMYAVVDLEGEVSGIARVLRGELKMKQHIGIFRTWLAETAQGQGIGKEVMAYTLEWGKSHHLLKICLTVFKSNEKAVKLYENYGFVIEGVQKDQVYLNGKYDDEIHMAYFFK